jgi:hypothetical protein
VVTVPEASEEIMALIEGGIRPVSAEEVRQLVTRGHKPKRGLYRRPRVYIPVGAVVVAAVVLALLLLPAGTPGGPQPAVASELTLFASRAANVNVLSLAPGQYFYTEIERQTTEISVELAPGAPTDYEYLNGTQQTWVDAQGYGRMVVTTDPTPQFFTKADQAAWKAAGSPPAAVPPNQLSQVVAVTPTSAGGLATSPLFQVTDLPTDPTALKQVLAAGRFKSQLESGPQCQSTDCTVVASAVALLQGPDIGATPALRSALFEVLSHVSGVTDLGTVTDKNGQSGIGLSFLQEIPAHTLTIHCASGTTDANMKLGPPITASVPASSVTYEFIVDPETTAVVGTQEVATPDMQPPPPNACISLPQSQKDLFVAPQWSGVLSEGIVGSETSTSLISGA